MKKKGNEEKTKFRSSKEWKEFRKNIITERGTYCECCGKKTRALQLHHKDPEHYTVLEKERFALLCSLCHKAVSDLERIKPENRKKLRAEWYVEIYGKFLISN